MNMTTTALWLPAASVSEKVFPSTVASVNTGAGAPTCGPAVSTARASRREVAVTRNNLERRMRDLLQPRKKLAASPDIPVQLTIFPAPVAARGVSQRGGASRCGSVAFARDQASDRGRIRPSRAPVRRQGAGPEQAEATDYTRNVGRSTT